jgi:hypothetical protein
MSGTLKCPECGHLHATPRTPKDYGGRNGTLVESVRDELPPETQKLLYQRYWGLCIGTAIKKRAKAGMALAMFKDKFRLFPWEAKVSPLPPRLKDVWKRPAEECFPGFAKQSRF